MTSVEQIKNLLKWRRVSDDECMDRLQDAGLVSDNCVHLEDVAEVDAYRVIPWIEKNVYPKRAT